jgi:hypothetical protein
MLHTPNVLVDSQQVKGTNNELIKPEFDDSLFLEKIINHADELQIIADNASNRMGVFIVKPANAWIGSAKSRPAPKKLFDELWFENEICCLFASSNVGKSILAMLIANSISKGIPIKGFQLEALMQMVLYFDYELSEKQFEGRYSENYNNHYIFSENLLRVELDSNLIPDGKSFEDTLNESLELSIVQTGSKILIIDNLTYLRNETEKSKEALTLMKYLKALKQKYGLSILILAHTPKRDFSRPLTINDLSGSSMLGNFFDSAFTIGASHKDKSLRYIKQIKVRETEKKYDSENVITCQIVKYTNFVEFEFIGYSSEREHLKEVTEKDREGMIDQVKELHKSGKSQRVISTELGIALGTVNKYLKLH